MKISLFILLIAVSFLSIHCIFEDITEFQNFNEFQDFVSNKDQTLCVYIFNSIDCQNCELANPLIEQFSEDMEDCDTLWEDKASREHLNLCHPKNTINLPQLLFFEPPANRYSEDRQTENKPKQHLYQGPVDVKSLSKFAKTIMPAFRTILSTQEEMNEFLSFTAIPNKVILFTNKEETPVLFRGLTAHFRERIEFGEIRQNAKSLLKKYRVRSFPKIMILKLKTDGSYEQIFYKGIIRFELIKEFISQFALERRLIKPKDRPKIREDEVPEFVSLNFQDFDQKVFENENYVLLYLFKQKNQEYKKLMMDKFEHLFEYFEIDCNDEENLKFVEDQLKVKSFPKMVYFPSGIYKNKLSKKIVFSKDDTLSVMMSDILQSFRIPLQQLSDGNVQQFILQTMQNQQTPLILSTKKQDSEELFFYTAYANEQKWQDRLVFGVAMNPTKVLKKILNLKKVPSLLSVIGKNEQVEYDHQVAHFQGDWDSRAIRGFISDIYSRSLVKLPSQNHVTEITNQEQMDKQCNGNHQYCFIGFFEGHERFNKRKGDKKLNSQLDILYSIEGEFGSKEFTFNWIDGQCFQDIISRFYILNPLEQMPIMIAYNQENNKYAYLTKEYNESNLRNFVNEIKKGTVQFIKPKEELDIDERNCQKFHENYTPIVKTKKRKSKKDEL